MDTVAFLLDIDAPTISTVGGNRDKTFVGYTELLSATVGTELRILEEGTVSFFTANSAGEVFPAIDTVVLSPGVVTAVVFASEDNLFSSLGMRVIATFTVEGVLTVERS